MPYDASFAAPYEEVAAGNVIDDMTVDAQAVDEQIAREATDGTEPSVASVSVANPFLQFTDLDEFRALVKRSGSKAGPARTVSPLTIAAKLQHARRKADPVQSRIDEELDEELGSDELDAQS
jgi:hypothetical protein